MASYADKKKRESKLKIMRDLGPPSPGGYTHEADGTEIEDEEDEEQEQEKAPFRKARKSAKITGRN